VAEANLECNSSGYPAEVLTHKLCEVDASLSRAGEVLSLKKNLGEMNLSGQMQESNPASAL
jgi:hypothetical protein